MADQDEERPLLDGEETNVQPETKPVKSCPTWKILASLCSLVLLSVGGACFVGWTSQRPTRDTALFSNGTHEFKRTVVLISIDGLRQVVRCSYPVHHTHLNDSASYLDRGLTPHLLDISKQGLRAKYMKPVFPVSSSLHVLYHR